MTSFWCSSKNVTVKPTSCANLSVLRSLRVILSTETSEGIETSILTWLGRHLVPSFGPAILMDNVPQNPGPSGISRPQFSHAHDRGPFTPADHAAWRERKRKIDPAPLDL